MKLKTAAIAKFLGMDPEAVRWMVRTKQVPWGIYREPLTPRYGRGTYYYFPQLFAEMYHLTDAQMDSMMKEA